MSLQMPLSSLWLGCSRGSLGIGGLRTPDLRLSSPYYGLGSSTETALPRHWRLQAMDYVEAHWVITRHQMICYLKFGVESTAAYCYAIDMELTPSY